MSVLFIVLNDISYLDKILGKFYELGVSGATILDSQGMASAIVYQEMESIPLFGSLKTLLKGSKPYNKTILTVIEDEQLLQKTIIEVKELLKDAPHWAGVMFTIPVGEIHRLSNK